MSAEDILKDARALISDPKHWTRRVEARSGRKKVEPWAPEANRWCSLGAMYRVGNDVRLGNYREWHKASVALNDAMGGWIGLFNDHHTHAEVLAAFDVAITELRSRP